MINNSAALRPLVLEATLDQVVAYAQSIEQIADIDGVRDSLRSAPATLTKGRSLLQIAMDDMRDAFENIMVDVPAADLPVECYRQILLCRGDRNITMAQAQSRLEASLQAKRDEKIIQPKIMPDHIALLSRSDKPALADAIASNWPIIVEDMAKLSMPEPALQATKTASVLIDAFDMAVLAQKNVASPKYAQMLNTVMNNMDASNQNTGRTGLPATTAANTPLPSRVAVLIKEGKGVDITQLARQKSLPHVSGRAKEIKALSRILLEKDKPFAMLKGAEGVGKSAIVSGLAQAIAQGSVPPRLKDARIVQVSVLDAFMKFGQMAPSVFEGAIADAAEHNKTNAGKIILNFTDYGLPPEALGQAMQSVRGIIAQALNRNPQAMVIAEADTEDLFVLEAKDAVSFKPYQSVKVEPLSLEDTLEEARTQARILETFHGIHISDDMIRHATTKTDRFMPTQHQPGKTVNALKAAASMAELHGSHTLTEEDINHVVAEKAKLPPEFVGSAMSDRIDNLGPDVKKRLFGQDQAVDVIAETVGLVNMGLNEPNKPLGVFYLTGPTGVGKTELAKALAHQLFGDEEAIIRVNLGEFGEKHTVSRILGAPPGYVGYGEKGPLDEVKERPFSVVLFDEAEKAHADVDNALMTMIDEGRMVKLNGKELDFRNCVIIFTSNLGATAAEAARKAPQIGFGRTEDVVKQEADMRSEEERQKAIRARLKPEFRNRVTLLPLVPLTENVVEKIALKKINDVSRSLRDNKLAQNMTLTVTPEAVKDLMSVGFDPSMGARPMNRAVKSHITMPLAQWLKDNKDGDVLKSKFELVVKGVKDRFDVEVRKVASSGPSPAPAI